MIKIKKPQTFHILDERSKQMHYGANQCWYKEKWQRTSGCGPTTYAHIIHYLVTTRTDLSSKIAIDTTNKTGFITLMDDIWSVVTPGLFGIYSINKFYKNALNYVQKNDVLININIIKIPAFILKRPSKLEITEFLSKALEKNMPVAFLNRSNGKVSNLSSWHWTTIIGFSPEDMMVDILDNGNNVSIDIGLWLRTTILGGGLVAFDLD